MSRPQTSDSQLVVDWYGFGTKDKIEVMQVQGKEIIFKRELQKDERSMLQFQELDPTTAVCDFFVENQKTGVGVHITSDRPMERLAVWAIRPTRCPERFIRLKADPGREFTWRITCEFIAR